MDGRALFLATAVIGAGGFASVTACSGPDPGTITFAERPGSPGEPQGTSGGPSGGGPSATPDSGGPTDPIFGTSTMTWVDPGTAANGANAAHGGSVEGKDCAQAGCHLGGGEAWLFGGTVYSTAQGGATVARAEIKVVGPDGAEVGKAYTDANGNFWVRPQGAMTSIPAGSRVGVRREGGAGTKMMATPLSNADAGCNANRGNCHGTAATGRVYVP